MGNVLCKSRKGQGQSNKSAIDGFIGRCTQICHNPIGKKKHFWDKQILETGPPCKQQPKSNDAGWNTVSLTVPDSPDYRPVPPPRKKRHSDRTNSAESTPQNSPSKHEEDDKKALLVESGEIESPSKNEEKYSNKSEENDLKENLKEKEYNSKLDNETQTEYAKQDSNVEKGSEILDKKPGALLQSISKIGNKKSDKFFGENLSESLSDKPIKQEDGNSLQKNAIQENHHETEKLENCEPKKNDDELHKNDEESKSVISRDETDNQHVKIESIDDSEEMVYKINKERGNLLFALQDQIPQKSLSEIDPNLKPVEEEIIVPVKRTTRHICDDDAHIHDILHKAHPNPAASDTIPPKKPQRDFSKYRKSLEIQKTDEPIDFTSQIIENTNHPQNKTDGTTTSPVLSASDDELHSEAETLPLEETPEKKSPPSKPKACQSLDMESLSPSSPQQSDLTRNKEIHSIASELIEAITQQANNLTMSPEGYIPEDYRTSSNDGSSSFSPNSKLTEKKHKISLSSLNDSTKFKTEPQVIANGEVLTRDTIEKNEKYEYEVDLNLQDKDEYLPNYEEATGIFRNSFTNSSPTITEIQQSSPTQITNAPSSVNVEVQEVSSKKLPIDPNFHRKVSSTKEISDAIKSFLTKDDLNSCEILKLLEDEFGDLLNSSCLSQEDQKLIQKLRDDANLIDDNHKTESSSSCQEQNKRNATSSLSLLPTPMNKQSANESSNEPIITIETKTVKIDNEFDLKSPSIINKALESVMSNEKRRHSIDDLDSWFSSDSKSKENKKNLDNDDDHEEIKLYRKREISLPNALDITTVTNSIKNNLSKEIKTNELNEKSNTDDIINDNKNSNNESITQMIKINDHSSLLKFLENEKANYSH